MTRPLLWLAEDTRGSVVLLRLHAGRLDRLASWPPGLHGVTLRERWTYARLWVAGIRATGGATATETVARREPSRDGCRWGDLGGWSPERAAA